VQVEVSVQDFYSTPSEPEGAKVQSFPGAISTQTWENWFSQWLETLQPDLPEAEGYELTLRLVSDRDIQSLNAQYRHKDRPTDVLAFAALEVNSHQLPPEIQATEPLYLGDLVISVETAERQGRQYGHSLTVELAWLAAHGFLHLLGWDHPDEARLEAMLARQVVLLESVGLNSPSKIDSAL
jgi:probable rRNA maturation factor